MTPFTVTPTPERCKASVPVVGARQRALRVAGEPAVIDARAAVLTDVRDARRLERGDVLVTRQTDPGWAPVFCLISGLVIERGGMLSHGAIIAREFGLPCVVGVKNATQRIPHASHVTVDGDLGICTVDSQLQPETIGPVSRGGARD